MKYFVTVDWFMYVLLHVKAPCLQKNAQVHQIRFIYIVESKNRTFLKKILIISLQTTAKSPRPQGQRSAEYCSCVLALEPMLVI